MDSIQKGSKNNNGSVAPRRSVSVHLTLTKGISVTSLTTKKQTTKFSSAKLKKNHPRHVQNS